MLGPGLCAKKIGIRKCSGGGAACEIKHRDTVPEPACSDEDHALRILRGAVFVNGYLQRHLSIHGLEMQNEKSDSNLLPQAEVAMLL